MSMPITITITEHTTTTYRIQPEKVAQHPALQRFIDNPQDAEHSGEIADVFQLLDDHADTGQYDVTEREISMLVPQQSDH